LQKSNSLNYIVRIDLLHIAILSLSIIEHIVASTKPEQAVVKPVRRKKLMCGWLASCHLL